jgi:hypothetical protein
MNLVFVFLKYTMRAVKLKSHASFCMCFLCLGLGLGDKTISPNQFYFIIYIYFNILISSSSLFFFLSPSITPSPRITYTRITCITQKSRRQAKLVQIRMGAYAKELMLSKWFMSFRKRILLIYAIKHLTVYYKDSISL